MWTWRMSALASRSKSKSSMIRSAVFVDVKIMKILKLWYVTTEVPAYDLLHDGKWLLTESAFVFVTCQFLTQVSTSEEQFTIALGLDRV